MYGGEQSCHKMQQQNQRLVCFGLTTLEVQIHPTDVALVLHMKSSTATPTNPSLTSPTPNSSTETSTTYRLHPVASSAATRSAIIASDRFQGLQSSLHPHLHEVGVGWSMRGVNIHPLSTPHEADEKSELMQARYPGARYVQ
jgi:hypothetical protein